MAFALQLTHRYEALLPLLICATTAFAVSVLVLRRSVLTEKIARRGLHLTREYSVDPLEILFVHEVISRDGTSQMSKWASSQPPAGAPPVHPDDTLRHVAYVMAESGCTELAVVDRDDPSLSVETVTLEQLLQGRLRDLHKERHSERVLRPLALIGVGGAGSTSETALEP